MIALAEVKLTCPSGITSYEATTRLAVCARAISEEDSSTSAPGLAPLLLFFNLQRNLPPLCLDLRN